MLMMLASTSSKAPNHLEELQTSGALGFGVWKRREFSKFHPSVFFLSFEACRREVF